MNNDQSKSEQDIAELTKKIERLNELTERRVSWKYVWGRGIVMGVAGAIGASIIAGILFWVLAQFFSFAELEAINQFIPENGA